MAAVADAMRKRYPPIPRALRLSGTSGEPSRAERRSRRDGLASSLRRTTRRSLKVFPSIRRARHGNTNYTRLVHALVQHQHIPGDDWHRETCLWNRARPLARSATRLPVYGIQRTRDGHTRPPCFSPVYPLFSLPFNISFLPLGSSARSLYTLFVIS